MLFRTMYFQDQKPSQASKVFMLSVMGARVWRGFASKEKSIMAKRQHEDIKRYGLIRPINVR